MKKVAIAVLVILVLIVVGIGGVGYYFYNKAKAFIGPIQQYAALDKDVTNTAKFAPPSNGELTEDQVKRFMAVQESMVTKLGPTFNEMKAKQDTFMQREQAEHRKSTPSEDFTVITDMMKFILMAKNAWVEALNQQHYSIDEYYWVRGRVYAAAGMSVEELGLRKLTEAIKEGGAAAGASMGDLTSEVATQEPVPDRNKELIAPYMPKLKDWAVFAFFGL
jgi:hypothetical protein